MSLQEIAVAPVAPSDLFALLHSEEGDGGEVSVWSLARRDQLARFPVDWDLGGDRLALSADGPVRVFTAAYHRHGVSAYALDGQRVWQRKDLKQVQHLTAFRDAEGRACLAVGAEAGPLTVVDAGSGETRARLRGAEKLLAAAHGASLHLLSDAVRLEHGTPPRAQRVPLESFSVLDAAFSADALAFSEAGGALRCFSMAGAPLWELDFGRETTHALEVAWNAAHQLWLAVVWNYKQGGPPWLHRINAKGEQVARESLEPCPGHRLSKAGDVVVLGDGRVLDAISNEVLLRFGS